MPRKRMGNIILMGEPLDMENDQPTIILPQNQFILISVILITLLLLNLICLSYYNCCRKAHKSQTVQYSKVENISSDLDAV